MRLCIAGPLATADLAHLLDHGGRGLPAGYAGAPLVAVLVEALLRRGHEVHALTVDYSGSGREAPARAKGANLTYTVVAGRPRAWRSTAGVRGSGWDAFGRERAQLVRAILSEPVDLVHAHWTYEFALAAQASGVPHVVTAHDVPTAVLWHARDLYRVLRWVMARQALGRARSVTTVSEHVAKQLASWCQVPIRVVPNPVAPQAIQLGRWRARPEHAALAVVCNGWSSLKNVGAALAAFQRIRQQLPAASLHLYGEGFEPAGAAECRARGAGFDLAGMHWHGRLAHSDLIASLSSHDLLLHPALEESFGMAVAEAMALGLPVVGGLRSGAVAAVAGPLQWLVDVRDPEAIAAAALEALQGGQRYAEASRAARERAQSTFAVDRVVNAYEDVYRQVQQTRACSPLS